jgi:hypothetical protein
MEHAVYKLPDIDTEDEEQENYDHITRWFGNRTDKKPTGGRPSNKRAMIVYADGTVDFRS